MWDSAGILLLPPVEERPAAGGSSPRAAGRFFWRSVRLRSPPSRRRDGRRPRSRALGPDRGARRWNAIQSPPM